MVTSKCLKLYPRQRGLSISSLGGMVPVKRKSMSWAGIGRPASHLVTILTDLPQIQVNRKAEVRKSVTCRAQTGLGHEGQMNIRIIELVSRSGHGTKCQEYFLGRKGDRCVGLTTLSPSCAGCLEIWESQPAGTLRACPGL